jgi:hypothetical protein
MFFAARDTPSIKRLFIESHWHKLRDSFALFVPFLLSIPGAVFAISLVFAAFIALAHSKLKDFSLTIITFKTKEIIL